MTDVTKTINISTNASPIGQSTGSDKTTSSTDAVQDVTTYEQGHQNLPSTMLGKVVRSPVNWKPSEAEEAEPKNQTEPDEKKTPDVSTRAFKDVPHELVGCASWYGDKARGS